ncbi:hypothetical protein TIFTF001_044734 [Ficus carica]|uniref:2-oxoacid dehydrogenase acyltransferase catalytic domain-containing protein n=1 Tax=Ficus carica TaxID=3494 RepID=A0AA87ZFI8_FICCA|nr:hypothetical protein TIFTF001_044734 [Ficus carica]
MEVDFPLTPLPPSVSPSNQTHPKRSHSPPMPAMPLPKTNAGVICPEDERQMRLRQSWMHCRTSNSGKSFTYNSDINIAVAVAINGGLITPILQDADKMDLYLLSQKWKELVEKARSKQLQPHEYSSETFTLSSLGMFEVDRFDAILLSDQGLLWLLSFKADGYG